jgi:hypothetical protein
MIPPWCLLTAVSPGHFLMLFFEDACYLPKDRTGNCMSDFTYRKILKKSKNIQTVKRFCPFKKNMV